MDPARAAGRPLLILAMALALLEPVQSLDRAVQRSVQGSRSAAGDTFMRGVMRVTQPATVLGSLLAIAIVGGPAGVATARAVIAVLLPVNAMVELTKAATHRIRPDASADPRNSSFPSSHAANAAALALVLARRWRRGLPIFALVAGVVSYARIYLNRHFLSDVVCAAIIGLVVGWLVLHRLRGTAWSWEPARPRVVGGTPSLC
jgi:membrane-associated phospholipid phosphatase